MPDAAPSRDWISLALAVFFLAMGLRDLTADPPKVDTATWELMFAAANGLLFWSARGAPAWVRTVGYALVFGGLLAAVSDLFL